MTVSPESDEWNFTGREELEQLLREFNLTKDDICLVGSISLSVRGLREHDDLDVCIHSEKRQRVDPDAFDGFVAHVEERYENIENAAEDGTFETDVAGRSTTVTRFTADARLIELGQSVEIYLYVSEAVEVGDDFVVTVAAHPRAFGREEPLVRTLMAGVGA